MFVLRCARFALRLARCLALRTLQVGVASGALLAAIARPRRDSPLAERADARACAAWSAAGRRLLGSTLTISRNNAGLASLLISAAKRWRVPCVPLAVVRVRQKTLRVFVLQLAAASCIVVVTGQTMNAADALALNATLDGLGCWRSAICAAKNFSCAMGPPALRCVNGSVTYLYVEQVVPYLLVDSSPCALNSTGTFPTTTWLAPSRQSSLV